MSEIPGHSGHFKIIKVEHGTDALKAVRHYVNTASKISRIHQHIAFNQRCRRYQLVPRSLRVKPLVPTSDGRCIARRAGRQFLSARVRHCYGKLKNLEIDIFFQKRQLDFALGPQKSAALEVYKEEAQTKITSKTKERHKRKFDKLLTEQSHPQSYGSHRVVNLFTKQLDESHISAISKALILPLHPGRSQLPIL